MHSSLAKLCVYKASSGRLIPLLSPLLLSQNKTLEQETSQLEKDKKLLEKENKRLRQQAEIRDSKLDDNNQRISALEKENRTMGKEMIFFRDSCTRVKDLERENKELVKQGSIDKKTLIALREVRKEPVEIPSSLMFYIIQRTDV